MLLTHWAIPAAEVQALLPAGVTVDTFGGTAWVSVVAYRMAHVRLRGMPAIFAQTFPQLNLRTYVIINGQPGIYFLSLDAGSGLAVRTGAWVTDLPYHVADMRLTTHQQTTTMASQRRLGGPAFEASYTPGETLRPAMLLDHWLTQRYVFFTPRSDGRLRVGPVCHGPWPLASVTASITRNTFGEHYGLDLSGAPAHLQYSEGVDVLFWWPQTLAL